MKISEVIKQLQDIQNTKGDLICVVEDGYYPSEPSECDKIEIVKFQPRKPDDLRHEGDDAVAIRSL